MRINGYELDTTTEEGFFKNTKEPFAHFMASTKLAEEEYDPATNTARCTLLLTRVSDRPEDLFKPDGRRMPDSKEEEFVRIHMYYADGTWTFDKAERRRVKYTWNKTRTAYDTKSDSGYSLAADRVYGIYTTKTYDASALPKQTE